MGAPRQYLEKLKSFCNIIIQYDDYDAYEYSCINMCLNINKYIGEYSVNAGECNFSQRLISFIGNILKWVKYIVPVIVIVLGILDFIKALSSDKDDEMKKAQGKFMKRLIAAALVFIVPLILEFILNKMGFDYNECGLF